MTRWYCLMLALFLMLLNACRDAEQTVRTSPVPSAAPATRLVAPSPSPTAPAPTPIASTAFNPKFDPGPCPFKVGIGHIEGRTVICGTVAVPEEHARPNGPRITLAVARFPATGSRPQPEPLFWLDGGPGGPSLSGTAEQMNSLVSRLFTGDRDLVLFDQRGAGFSRPSLNCPENIDLKYRTLDQRRTPEQVADDDIAAITACRDRLRAQGVNLAAYTSAENAADVNALRIALGYDRVNLYGVSYGTRLALTVMRDFPSIIRSVVLDSTVPLQSNLYVEVAANAQRAFDELFDGCAADPACTAAFPNLRGVFTDLANRLNANPVMIQVTHPRTDRTYNVLLTGDQFVGGLFQALYRSDLIPSLPKIIFAVRDGRYQPFANAVRDILFYDDLSYGMYYSVQCGEELSFTTPDQVAAGARQAQPEVTRALSGDAENRALFTVCDQWGAREAVAVENQPVRSDIPTLILAGQFDPITPPAWGQLVGASLSRAFFFQYPSVGHGAMVAAICPLNMTQAFLKDPDERPDAGCLSRMSAPQWQT